MEAELKVLVQMKGDRFTVGVQAKDTDPVVEVLTGGTLEEALAAVPEVLARAREKWSTSPKNPAYVGPPPPPAPARTAQTGLAAPRRSEPQQRFF